MPFDSMAMAASADEIRNRVLGGRIQRILQPSIHAVALSIHARGVTSWVVLSADARFARAHLSPGKLAKAFPAPSPFVMLLRKYLEDGHVEDVSRVPFERVLFLTCRSRERSVRLASEVMGKHSNVILVGDEDRVLGAMKTISPRQSRVRPVMPGRTYDLPPARSRDESIYAAGPRPDPVADPSQVKDLIDTAPGSTPCRDALLGLLPGASPFLAGQICFRVGVGPDTPLGEASRERLVLEAARFYAMPGAHSWNPFTFRDARGRLDFAPFEPLEVAQPEPQSSVGEAVEMCMAAGESRDGLASARKAILDAVDRALRGAERRADSLRKGLSAAVGADEVMRQGQLILAYQWAVEPRASELRVPDLEVTIPLDPALSPQENAERRFRRYRKLRDAASRIPALLAATEREIERLRDHRAFIEMADSEGALRDLERGIAQTEPRDIGRSDSARATKRAKGAKRAGPMRFRRDGASLLVGRNGRENEEVTFRRAGRDDLWLHARERTGAHVVLQVDQAPARDDLVEAAAALAAYYSEGRQDTQVDVDAAAVRDVRRIPAGPPGRVTHRNARTIRVAPSLDGWERDQAVRSGGKVLGKRTV